MKKTRLAILGLAVVGTAFPLGAQVKDAATFFSYLPSAEKVTLLSQKELTAVGTGNRRLAAQAPFAAEVSAGLSVSQPTVAVEGLFLFPRPEGPLDPGLYNALNAVASMEGLEYYSVTRKQREPLILASWRVVSKDKPVRAPDPTFTTVPAFQRAVVFQKDNKLGEGLSELTWKSLGDGAVVLTIRNLQTLNYGILPLVEPGNLQMLFVVVPLADKIAVYGVMEGRTAQLFGLEKSRDESFRNRMRALADWLGQRIATLPSGASNP